MNNCIRVFIIDDHPVVRAGLTALLKQCREISVVGDAEDAGEDTLARVSELGVDVAIVDIKLKVGSGIDACREIKRGRPETGVILLSAFWDDVLVRDALAARADGYLLKDAEQFDLTKSVSMVAKGQPFFDPAISGAIVRQARGDHGSKFSMSFDELQILRLVANGLTNKAIAASLYLSHHTIRDRLSGIMGTLGAKNRTEAAQIATREGLL